MSKFPKLIVFLLLVVSIVALIEIFGPSTPSRQEVHLELDVPPDVLSRIDLANLLIEYAAVPTVKEATQYLDANHRKYLDFKSTRLTPNGTIEVEIPLVQTRSPLGRIVMEETCKAIVLQAENATHPEEPKLAFVIPIPTR